MTKWDVKTLQEFVNRLIEHYPHSPSVRNTIYSVATEMLAEVKNETNNI